MLADMHAIRARDVTTISEMSLFLVIQSFVSKTSPNADYYYANQIRQEKLFVFGQLQTMLYVAAEVFMPPSDRPAAISLCWVSAIRKKKITVVDKRHVSSTSVNG